MVPSSYWEREPRPGSEVEPERKRHAGRDDGNRRHRETLARRRRVDDVAPDDLLRSA
jgi:hypothetical protein